MSSIATASQNVAMGSRLASVRAATGLSQNTFATGLGLSPRAYANYERGEREAPVAVLRTLLELHDIDPVWMLMGPEADPVHVADRRLNMAILEAVVRVVEDGLHRAGKNLKPDKKARLIRLAYERSTRAGEADTRAIRDLLSLAA